jgi:hypothetical protein
MAYSLVAQQHVSLVSNRASPLKYELVLAVTLLAVGLILVPAAIYWFGEAVVGDYAGEEGMWGLVRSIWADAGNGRPAAWGLLLAPYLVVQLVRLSVVCLRPPPAVTEVTNNETYQ